MPVYRLTNDNFDKVLEQNALVVVDFWAEWCTTCTSFTSIYEVVAESHPELLFAKVNTQLEQDISVRYRIQSIPTLLVFHNGAEIYRKPGAMASNMIEDMLNEIKNDLSPLNLNFISKSTK
ncbi:MAG: thioredoxin family protein [Gammaproteobacteria bacterium]|nr:thioredoxin family protein [Gammaproteobacteria bacterium]